MIETNLSTHQLVEKYIDFAEEIAKRFTKKMHLNDDFYQEAKSSAYIGLMDAAMKYKGDNCGVPFKGFAFYRVRGAIIDTLRKNTHLTDRYSKLVKCYSAVASLDGNVISIREEDKEDEKIAKIFDLVSKGALVFKIGNASDAINLKMANTNEIPEKAFLIKEQNKRLCDAIEKLPEKEKLVIKEYYFNDKTFLEISKMTNQHSKSWIARLHSKAISKLEEMLREE